MSDFSKMFEGFMKQGQEMAEQMGKDFAKNQADWLDKAKGMMPESMADMAQGMVGDGLDAKRARWQPLQGLRPRVQKILLRSQRRSTRPQRQAHLNAKSLKLFYK